MLSTQQGDARYSGNASCPLKQLALIQAEGLVQPKALQVCALGNPRFNEVSLPSPGRNWKPCTLSWESLEKMAN